MADTSAGGGGGPSSLKRGTRGTRAWYWGSTVGLIWLVFPIIALWTNGLPLVWEIIGQVLLVAWSGLYVIGPPRFWQATTRRKVLFTALFFATTLIFVPFLGVGVTSLWVFVTISLAMTVAPTSTVAVVSGIISLLSFAAIAVSQGPENAFWLPLLTFSISMMMSAFARQIDLVHRLRDAQNETARLAVEQERTRVARDLHDILGHSLTVITVKAELAGRLIDEHPERAATEITDIERLARGALADVRATVTGYRGVNLAVELSGARAALNSAGIEADLPNSVDGLDSDRAELFAWVVREGVTNVIRHSGAGRCSVTVDPQSVSIQDNGHGPAGADGDLTAGNGLGGLSERAAAAGASLQAGRAPGGGFLLQVTS